MSAIAAESVTYIRFGLLLRRYRHAAGLSQEALAAQAGVSAGAVSALEREQGRSPRLTTVALLADALGLDEADRDRLRAAARPPKVVASPVIAPVPLSIPATSMIGREHEIAAIGQLLRRGDTRLVTITGPGGVGKTRLALAVATDLSASLDIVAFAALASLVDPESVPAALAQALGLRETGRSSLAEVLRRQLQRRRALLVVDNLEHLLPAATLLAELLAACPGLTILATSRSPLHLQGEVECPVRPLPKPDPNNVPPPVALAAVPSVALFVARARTVRPDFALSPANAAAVAAICARLDGLPLALELAAARIRVLSATTLLALLSDRWRLLSGGMRDAPPRQRTMSDAIAWSYDLLAESEQRLFRHLSIFAGGCALDAAEWMMGDGSRVMENDGPSLVTVTHPPSPSTPDGVTALVNHSLLQTEHGADGETRYVMLETIREYGLDRLAARGEEPAARQRHAAYYLALAERAEPRLAQAVETAWLDRLEREHDNLRSALGWLEAAGPAPSYLRMAGALWWLWYYHSHLAEGRSWLERSLARCPHPAPLPRAKALLGLGTIAHSQGDDAGAAGPLTESLTLWQTLGDAWGTAFALTLLGIVAEDRGDYVEAAGRFTEANALFRDVDDHTDVAITRCHLGIVAYGRGDLAGAATLLAEALAGSREAGDPWGAAMAAGYAGLVAADLRDIPGAVAFLGESLALMRQQRFSEGIARCLANIATLAQRAGRFERATLLFAAATAMHETVGAALSLPERLTYERAEAAAQAALPAPTLTATVAAGRALSFEQAIAEALSELDDLAALPAAPAASPHSAAGSHHGLTPRELEVLRLVAAGHSNRVIAQLLSISERTVETHVLHILSKLDLPSRTAAATAAMKQGLA